MKILLLSLALISTSLLSGCANHDKEKPWKRTEPKWYEGDMDQEDKNFFLGFFYNH